MFCNTCGADNAEGVTICEKCGAPLSAYEAAAPAPEVPEPPASASAPSPSAPLGTAAVCPSCGAENAPDYRFCKNCGVPAGQMAAPIVVTQVAAPAPGQAGSAFVRFVKSKGAAAALVGAAVGIAFILLAAFLVRPMYSGLGNTANLGTLPAAQVKAVENLVDKMISIPFLATSLNLPAETIKIKVSVAGSVVDASLDAQAPVTKWSGLGVLAIALAAFVSVLLSKPTTTRDALLQGAVTCVPYALGVIAIAAVASLPIQLDLASLGIPEATAAGATVTISYSFAYVALALFLIVAGSVLGALIGLLYITFTSRRSFGDLVRESRLPFAAPVAGTLVALAVAMLLSFPATAAIWAHLRTEIPASAYSTVDERQGMALLDDAVLTESPSLAIYAYTFGHGAPLTMKLKGAFSGAGTPGGSLDGIIRASLLGVSGEEKTTGVIPDPPKYESWVYFLVLLPIIPLLVGGYFSAAWSDGSRFLPLEGAKMAIPYTLAILGLAWVSTLALKADVSLAGFGSGNLEFAFGPDFLLLAALGLAWGGTFGTLGGWIRQRRSAA